jgi:hypothetical protein
MDLRGFIFEIKVLIFFSHYRHFWPKYFLRHFGILIAEIMTDFTFNIFEKLLISFFDFEDLQVLVLFLYVFRYFLLRITLEPIILVNWNFRIR